MPAAKVSLPITNPKFGYRLSTGAPAVGYKVQSYLAGTVTPSPTYTTPDNGVANANPVILDANGEATIWPGLLALDLVLKDTSDVTQWTFSNWTPVAAVGSFSEWVQSSATPTYVSATSFTVATDLRTTFAVGRRNRAVVTAGTAYGTIVSSTYSAPNTTITLLNDAGSALDSGLSVVSYGLLDSSYRSAPQGTTCEVTYPGGASLVTNTALNAFATGATVIIDRLSEFDTGTGTLTIKQAGDYQITAMLSIVTTGVTFGSSGAVIKVFKTGGIGTSEFPDVTFAAGLGSPATVTAASSGLLTFAAGNTLTVNAQAHFSAGTPTLGACALSVIRIR